MPTINNSSDNSLLSRLRELEQETDNEFVLELIDIYLTETPKQIQTINAAINTQDFHTLTIASHTLKGSSLNLGAKQLGALCFSLEELGRSGKIIPEGTSIKEIEAEFERVKNMLSAFKQNK